VGQFGVSGEEENLLLLGTELIFLGCPACSPLIMLSKLLRENGFTH